jgi:dTMP kinase
MNKKLNNKFIVIEGPDGSGKATQTKLIIEYLKKEKYKVKKIDFPQYGKKSAGLVEEYLNGKYGKAEEIGPYRASIFYACDRYDASFKIKKWLEEGFVVVSDRYVSSNVAHQGGKIKDKKERKEYIKWLYNLEYKIFEIPKPEITVILKTSTASSYELSSKITDKEKKAKKHLYLGDKKRDIHEEDKKHLADSLSVYLEMAKEYPEEFIAVECLDKEGNLLSREEIHNKVKKVLEL